uniref:Uncharacterized protein n=1 Tax=Meleagris gallopavo TaxID=9103 RepID=A0A803Y7D3_MELGA
IWLLFVPWLGHGCVWLFSLWSHRNCPSLFKRKKEKQGTSVRHESQQHQPGRKAPAYENVTEFPVYATVNKRKNTKQDDSIHYADIQVFTKVRERSAEEKATTFCPGYTHHRGELLPSVGWYRRVHPGTALLSPFLPFVLLPLRTEDRRRAVLLVRYCCAERSCGTWHGNAAGRGALSPTTACCGIYYLFIPF